MPHRPSRGEHAYSFDRDSYDGRYDQRDAPQYQREPPYFPPPPSQPESAARGNEYRPAPPRRASSDAHNRDDYRDSPRPARGTSRRSPSPGLGRRQHYERSPDREANRHYPPPAGGESRRNRPPLSSRTMTPPDRSYEPAGTAPRHHRSISPPRRSKTTMDPAGGRSRGAPVVSAARPGLQRSMTTTATTAKGVLQNKRFQQAAAAAFRAGSVAAMSARRDPGAWAGQKGVRVATAALGAAAMDAFAKKQSSSASERDRDGRHGDRSRDRSRDRDRDRGRDRDRDRGKSGGAKKKGLEVVGTALGGLLIEQLTKKASNRR